MNKYIIIDKRMRDCEKEYLKGLEYILIELPKSNEVYPEISSHVDIFVCKINNTCFFEKSVFEHVLYQIDPFKRHVSDRKNKNTEKLIQKT